MRYWAEMLAWLRREEYVRAMVAEAAKNGYLEGHAAGLAVGQQAGYQIGRAHGELIGRETLALELQQRYGIGGGEAEMTRDEIATLKVRQLH